MPTAEDFAEFGWGETRPPPLEVPPPSVGSTGTQSEEETGRGVVVAGISSGPRYPIGVFDKEGFGTTYCGALVRDKMCVRSACTIQSHKTKKVKDLFPLTGDEEQVVMIYSGPVADRKASVSLIPRLSPSMFGDKLSECLVLSKAHESWLMVFEAMAKTNSNVGARDPEDDVNVTEVLRMTEMPVSFAMSPRALPKPTESKSRSSPENVGISRMQVPWSLVGSQDEVVTVLRGSWPLLVDHVHELKDVVTAIQESIRANRNEVAAEFNQLDYKIATIKALLGDRADELGTTTVFSLLADLSRDFEHGPNLSQAEVAELARRAAVLAATEAATAAAEAVIKARVFGGQFHDNVIKPTLGLLKKTSDHPATPGNKWEERFQQLELAVLRPASIPSAPPPTDQFFWGQSTSAPVQATSTDYEARLGRLEARMIKYEECHPDLNRSGHSVQGVATTELVQMRTKVEELIVANQEMRDEASSTSVRMGNLTFKSAPFTKAWMDKVKAVNHSTHFLDPISLLSLADTLQETEQDAAKSRELSSRVKDRSVDDTKLKASFNMEVPTIFGKTADTKTTSASRALAALPTFQDWDSGMGYDGVKQKLINILDDGSARLVADIDDHASSESAIVAKQMLLDARNFWNEFILWISTFYTETKNRSNTPEATIWSLVSHCVRVVFSELRRARHPGTTLTSGGMMWGALQAHRVAKEMLQLKFAGYPKIALILHQHVIDHCTPIALFNSLLKDVEDMKKDNLETRNVAHKALSAANASKKK
jgi:hypothetical protein